MQCERKKGRARVRCYSRSSQNFIWPLILPSDLSSSDKREKPAGKREREREQRKKRMNVKSESVRYATKYSRIRERRRVSTRRPRGNSFWFSQSDRGVSSRSNVHSNIYVSIMGNRFLSLEDERKKDRADERLASSRCIRKDCIPAAIHPGYTRISIRVGDLYLERD